MVDYLGEKERIEVDIKKVFRCFEVFYLLFKKFCFMNFEKVKYICDF